VIEIMTPRGEIYLKRRGVGALSIMAAKLNSVKIQQLNLISARIEQQNEIVSIET
jgi:hypothetical protein